MSRMPEISVVVPVYRNEKELRELTSRLVQSMNRFDHEIIFVNDCSPDQSIDTLIEISEKHQQIVVVDLKKNVGQHKATLEGLKKASGQYIVVLDADLQDQPELIIELHKEVIKGKKAVFVKRDGMYQSRGRMFTSWMIKRTVQLLSGLHHKAGSYYMLNAEILERVMQVATKTRRPYMSIIVAHFCGKPGYISAKRGKSISSSYSFLKRLKAAWKAIYCSLYCTYFKLTHR